MLQGEHFAILLTFIRLLFVIKIYVLSNKTSTIRMSLYSKKNIDNINFVKHCRKYYADTCGRLLSVKLVCWERADLGSRLWCLAVSLSLSHWYPGSGVVLDCIDS